MESLRRWFLPLQSGNPWLIRPAWAATGFSGFVAFIAVLSCLTCLLVNPAQLVDPQTGGRLLGAAFGVPVTLAMAARFSRGSRYAHVYLAALVALLLVVPILGFPWVETNYAGETVGNAGAAFLGGLLWIGVAAVGMVVLLAPPTIRAVWFRSGVTAHGETVSP